MNSQHSHHDYISVPQMEVLTGYKQPSKQCRTLRQWGVKFHTRTDGRPQTTWTLFNGVNGTGSGTANETRQEPDFSALL